MTARQSQGWSLWFAELFDVRWRELRARVKHLKATVDEPAFSAHPDVTLFAALVNSVHALVPADPDAPQFLLGNTLGTRHRGWRHVKGNGLPSRTRLFFKFSTSKKVIVYAWLNDAKTLRKQGGTTDVYVVFQGMLKAGNPPDNFDSLLEQASSGK